MAVKKVTNEMDTWFFYVQSYNQKFAREEEHGERWTKTESNPHYGRPSG